MKSYEQINAFIKDKIGEGKEFPRQIDMAKFLNLPQTQATKLYNFLNKQADTSYKDVIEWFIKLGGSFEFENKSIATIQRMGTNSPVEKINENDEELIKYVPVCTCAGAGAEIDYDAVNEVDFVPILKEYWHENLRIVKIEGDSMDPTIKDGSCVGVIPYTSKKLKAGKIYLVNIPDFGYVVKRVYPGEKQGTIQLVSDNKNHKDKTIDCNGYEHVIIAEVVWVWQKM